MKFYVYGAVKKSVLIALVIFSIALWGCKSSSDLDVNGTFSDKTDEIELLLESGRFEEVYNITKYYADKGDLSAICDLAASYQKGIYVARDYKMAFSLYKRRF